MAKLTAREKQSFIKLAMQEMKKNGRSILFMMSEDAARKSLDVDLMINLAYNAQAYPGGEATVANLGDTVVELGNLEQNFIYAQLKGADIRKHQRVIMESNNVDLIHEFGMKVQGANLVWCYQAVKNKNKQYKKELKDKIMKADENTRLNFYIQELQTGKEN